MKDIAILGIGGFAREVATIIKAINSIKPTWNLLGFVDNSVRKGTIINGYPVIGNDEQLLSDNRELALVLSFGSPELKKRLHLFFKNTNIYFPPLIHPSTIVGDIDFIRIGSGSIICAGCILTTNIVLDDFVTLNLKCTVGHDTVIGKYSSFMPSVNISGDVFIGECVYVGTGAKLINRIKIGDNSIIGAGAVVTKNLPENCTAVGVPARPIKFNK